MGVAATGEIPGLTGEFTGEAHGILECIQTHPPGNQHLKGHNFLVGSQGSDRQWGWSRASDNVPSLTPLRETGHNKAKRVAPPWRIPKTPPLAT